MSPVFWTSDRPRVNGATRPTLHLFSRRTISDRAVTDVRSPHAAVSSEPTRRDGLPRAGETFQRGTRRDDASLGTIAITFVIGLVVGALVVAAIVSVFAVAGVPLLPHRGETASSSTSTPHESAGESSGGSR